MARYRACLLCSLLGPLLPGCAGVARSAEASVDALGRVNRNLDLRTHSSKSDEEKTEGVGSWYAAPQGGPRGAPQGAPQAAPQAAPPFNAAAWTQAATQAASQFTQAATQAASQFNAAAWTPAAPQAAPQFNAAAWTPAADRAAPQASVFGTTPGKTFGAEPYWKLIKNSDVGMWLDFPTAGSKVPWCWQGLMWMDQNFMARDLLLSEDPTYVIGQKAYGRDIPDYAISVLDSWDGFCVHLGYMDRSNWGYEELKMTALMGCPARNTTTNGTSTFCLENFATHGPCDEGAMYGTDETREQMGFSASMTMEWRNWGWDRKTHAVPTTAMTQVLGEATYSYPVFSLIDPNRQVTKYWNTYIREANNDFDCTLEGTSEVGACPKNENDRGYSMICTTRPDWR